MSSVFPGPSGAFDAHIKLTLSALGVEETPSWLLAGVIMNVMVPMVSPLFISSRTRAPTFQVKTTSAQLKVNHITSWIVLSLRNEISTLCAAYHIDNVEFHFDSPLVSSVRANPSRMIAEYKSRMLLSSSSMTFSLSISLALCSARIPATGR
jgi:hypothetical protein